MENKKNIMIIGAGGSLGRYLCNLLADHKILAVDINENSLSYLSRVDNVGENLIHIEDIRNFEKLKSTIEYYGISLVINCAAMKHVQWCEKNIKSAIEINIIANLELINYLSKHNKQFIYISSDKACNPKNIYALTKQFADYMIKMYDFKLVRGVNFVNSKGSVLDMWNEQNIYGRPFTVVDDKTCNRYFITIEQMARLVKRAVEDDGPQNEYCPEIVYKIYIQDLFRAYLKLNNIHEPQIKKIYLSKMEKITEDLNFDTKVVELKNEDEIIKVLLG